MKYQKSERKIDIVNSYEKFKLDLFLSDEKTTNNVFGIEIFFKINVNCSDTKFSAIIFVLRPFSTDFSSSKTGLLGNTRWAFSSLRAHS